MTEDEKKRNEIAQIFEETVSLSVEGAFRAGWDHAIRESPLVLSLIDALRVFSSKGYLSAQAALTRYEEETGGRR